MGQVSPSRGAHWHQPDRLKACITCGEAKPLGEFYAYDYTTRQGKPGTRYESRCKPCARIRRRVAFAANPALGAAQSKAWRSANPRRTAKNAAAYRATEHGRRVKAKLQRLRKARLRASMNGPEDSLAIRAVYERAIDLEQIIAPCPVFDLPELGKRLHVDHIIPLAKGGQHVADNLQILPAGLNLRKGASLWVR